MKFRSILLAEARGSMAGATFSRNGNSAYVRARATPVNPRSPGQTLSRTALAYVSASWRQLLQSQQDAWKQLAQSVPYVNSLGETSFYSGFQMFMKLNQTLQTFGLAIIQNAPAGAPTFVGMAISKPIAEQDSIVFGDFSLNSSITVTSVPTDSTLQVQSTAPMSGGTNFVAPSLYRTTSLFTLAATTTPLALTPDYVSVYGIPTASLVGSAIFTRFRMVDNATGFVTPWTEFKTIVTEA
jgi:hypothetical protein